jgi:hypothetical protein
MGIYVFDVYTNVVYEVCVNANNMKEARKMAKKLFLDGKLTVEDEELVSIEPWKIYLDENGETLI